MDFKQLEYILKIAEENNITKDAEKLYISQSALNQQLLKLEKELGTSLFHRSRTNWGIDNVHCYLSVAPQELPRSEGCPHRNAGAAQQQGRSPKVRFTPAS